jgi:hypothetical protein
MSNFSLNSEVVRRRLVRMLTGDAERPRPPITLAGQRPTASLSQLRCARAAPHWYGRDRHTTAGRVARYPAAPSQNLAMNNGPTRASNS